VHVRAGDAADEEALLEREGRGLVEAGGVAQRPFHQVLEEADGDVGEQQAADGLVDSRATGADQPASASHRAPASAPARQHQQRAREAAERERMRQRRRGQPSQHQGAFAADDGEAGAGRNRDAQGGEHQRRGALQRVLPGEPVAERALEQDPPDLHRTRAGERHEHAEQRERRGDGGAGSRASLKSARMAAGPRAYAGVADHALDQVVHLLELDVALLVGRARRDHGGAPCCPSGGP
jgi:hypothetical protein